jgi:hypothetical protein
MAARVTRKEERAMRLVGFLLVCSMIGWAAVGLNEPTASPCTPSESFETEIFRLATSAIGVIPREAREATGRVEKHAGETIEDFLVHSGVPWPEGSKVIYNEKTGTLLVANTPANMVLVRELVRLWDQPAYQVEVEARFVEIHRSRCFESSAEGRMLSLLLDSWTAPTSLPARRLADMRPPDSRRGLSIRAILAGPDFEFIWHALDGKDWSDLLSAPRVTTISGQRALVEVVPKGPGRRITLDVTPVVSADGRMITLVLKPEVAVLEKEGEAGELAVAEAVSVTTTVHLEDRETVVLGGFMPDKTGDPAGVKSDLLIFVTGRFIRPSSVLLERELDVSRGHGGSQLGRLESP